MSFHTFPYFKHCFLSTFLFPLSSLTMFITLLLCPLPSFIFSQSSIQLILIRLFFLFTSLFLTHLLHHQTLSSPRFLLSLILSPPIIQIHAMHLILSLFSPLQQITVYLLYLSLLLSLPHISLYNWSRRCYIFSFSTLLSYSWSLNLPVPQTTTHVSCLFYSFHSQFLPA